MLNIVIPMAGSGSRFVQAGYVKPKPFIDVCGKSMIERVLDNLTLEDSRFILLVRAEHLAAEQATLQQLCSRYPCEIVSVAKPTEGAACTVLLASRRIDALEPLLIANSDQIVEIAVKDFIRDSVKRRLDGSILTFEANHPKWSYARVGDSGYVTEVREKKVISTHATVGLYYFERGRDFVSSANQMIAANDRVRQEFYTAPAYNYAIRAGLKIGIYEIDASGMFGLGTPEDLALYCDRLSLLQR